MNEYETEESTRQRASRMHKAERQRQSSGETCAVCDVTNPHLLQRVIIEHGGYGSTEAHLCHNHARLLFIQKKRFFPERFGTDANGTEKRTLPGILVDQERLAFKTARIQNSLLYKKPDIPFTNGFALRDRDTTHGGWTGPVFQPYAKLKAVVKKKMRIAPFTQHSNCACSVCGEARPSMIEVHHVDRERNSDRAVFLCLNHHTLITLDQENEQPDDQLIQDLDERSDYACAMGANALLKLIGDYRAALSQRIPDQFDRARSFFETFHAPVDTSIAE